MMRAIAVGACAALVLEACTTPPPPPTFAPYVPEPPLECEPLYGAEVTGRVGHVARDGSYVVACIAPVDTDGREGLTTSRGCLGETEGDALVPMLLHRGAPMGERIDAYLDRDRSGRFMTVVRDGAVELIDTSTMAATTIPARVVDGLYALADLDVDGAHVLYARGDASDTALVIRSRLDGTERVLDVGGRTFASAHFVGGGRFIAVDVTVAHDVVDAFAPARWGTCRDARFDPPRGEPALERRFFRIRDASRVEGEVLASGDGVLLVRDFEGGIRIEDDSGEPRVVVPRSCDARVLGFWPGGRRMLVACAEGAYSRMRVYAEDGSHDLGVPTTQLREGDSILGRVVPIDERQEVVVDLATNRVIRLPDGHQFVGADDSEWMFEESRLVFAIRNVATSDTRTLLRAEDGEGVRTLGGSYTFLAISANGRIHIYDRGARVILGSLPYNTWDVTSDGRALMTRDREHGSGLCWLRPSP